MNSYFPEICQRISSQHFDSGDLPNVMRTIRSLAVVTPMANEMETAERFVEQVIRATSAIDDVRLFVVFDNVCTDGTYSFLSERARTEARLEVVWAPESRSVVDAYMKAYETGLDAGFSWILEVDAGLSHDPAAIPGFVRLAESGFDCVFGSRFMPGGSMVEAALSRRLISRGGTFLARVLLGSRLTDMTSGFQLFSREALTWILAQGIHSQGPFFQTEVKYHALRRFAVAETPIVHRAPSHNIGSASMSDAFRGLARLRRNGKLST